MMDRLYPKNLAPVLLIALVLLSSFSFAHLVLPPDNANFPPPPESDELLFYIQRNKNSNTVVYEANIAADGTLNAKTPLEVYWIKYDEDPDGIRKDINYIESVFAFGFKSKPSRDHAGHHELRLVSYKKQHFDIYVDESGHARANFPINGKDAVIHKIYAQASETSWLPSVDYVELFGSDPLTGEPVYEKIFP